MENIIYGQLFYDPYSYSNYWTFYVEKSNMPFIVIDSQTETLKKKIAMSENRLFNFRSRAFKAKVIEDTRYVEVILEEND